MNHFGWSGDEVAPKLIHPILIDAASAGEQLGGIDEMGGTYLMDMDLRALMRPPAGRSGMIEVNVGDQDIADIRRGEAVAGQSLL
jgi:hypothetical protein